MKMKGEALGYFSLSLGGSHGFGNVGNQFSMSFRGIGVEGSHAINFCPTDEQALNKLLEEQPEPILRVLVCLCRVCPGVVVNAAPENNNMAGQQYFGAPLGKIPPLS